MSLTSPKSLLDVTIPESVRKELNEYAEHVYEQGVYVTRKNKAVEIHGSGNSRVVVSHPSVDDLTDEYNMVVKFALSNDEDTKIDGITQNEVELYIDSHSTKLSAYTLPVIDNDKSSKPKWIVYPLVEVATEDTVSELYQPWEELEQKGFVDTELFELRNWGFWNYQSYLIDFGFFNENPECESINITNKIY